MFRILIICTANICRSPTAQILLAKALEGHSVEVCSAGTVARNGDEADQQMQLLVAHHRLGQLSGHRSRNLLPSYVNQSDLVLCMEPEHCEAVLRLQPLAIGRTKLMGYWDGLETVDDPTGGLPAEYEKTLFDLKRMCGQWADKVVALGMC